MIKDLNKKRFSRGYKIKTKEAFSGTKVYLFYPDEDVDFSEVDPPEIFHFFTLTPLKIHVFPQFLVYPCRFPTSFILPPGIFRRYLQ